MASSPSSSHTRRQQQQEESDDDNDEAEVMEVEGFIPLPTEEDGARPPSVVDFRRSRRIGMSRPREEEVDEFELLEVSETDKRPGEGADGAVCSGKAEEDRSGLPSCPICMERWTSEGAHRVCCVPCGHVYGRSCLLKWAKHCGKNSVKCPQCNKKFKQKQIINLYAPLLAVASDDLEKEVVNLQVKNEALVAENKLLLEEAHNYKMQVSQLENSGKLGTSCWDHYLTDAMQQTLTVCSSGIHKSPRLPVFEPMPPPSCAGGGSIRCNIVLQVESEINEARVLDVDASRQIIMISRTVPLLGNGHVITKISLLVPNEMENVPLPPGIGVVRDLNIAPPVLPGRLALLASLGKKLSIFSMESNNVVLQYDLPGPAWSCSWDINNSFLAYAGLQDGRLLVFDIRQTVMPLRSHIGRSGYPIHTIHSVFNNHVLDSRTLFTASSVGTCLWDGDSVGEWPVPIPGTESRGVCIALACDASADHVVASFRPKVEPFRNNTSSQFSQPSSPSTGLGKMGTHILLKRRDANSFEQCQQSSGNVTEVRMARSAIFSVNGNNHMFAYGDEASRGLCIWDIPSSFKVIRSLKPHHSPILDVRHSASSGCDLLACISRSKLQVFSCSSI